MGNLGFTGQAHSSRLGWAAGCSALPRLDEELACALVPVVPKESRRCWAQLFSWPAMDGWKDQTSQPWDVFCRAAGSTTVLRVTARGKFGKVLSEQSGLLVTVACFGIGKGGSCNFALRWWRNELVAV